MPTPSQPMPHALLRGDRLDVLDALLGVAVLGILLFNVAAFSGYEFLSPERARMLHWSASDPVAASAIEVFVHGKFYSLFSLLFGVGFAVFMRRAESRGAGAAPRDARAAGRPQRPGAGHAGGDGRRGRRFALGSRRGTPVPRGCPGRLRQQQLPRDLEGERGDHRSRMATAAAAAHPAQDLRHATLPGSRCYSSTRSREGG